MMQDGSPQRLAPPIEVALLDEIAGRLKDIMDFQTKSRAQGQLLSETFVASTTLRRATIFYSATIWNDGTADIYVLDSPRTIDAADVPIRKGESFKAEFGESVAHSLLIGTLTGTATVRIKGLR